MEVDCLAVDNLECYELPEILMKQLKNIRFIFVMDFYVQRRRSYLWFVMYIVTEPEAEQDLLSDSSEGSDEIINLSSLSDSEPEDGLIPKKDLDNKVFEETHLENNSLKVHTCMFASFNILYYIICMLCLFSCKVFNNFTSCK